MSVKTVVAATMEPVSLPEAKAQLRVDGVADDPFIQPLISAARRYLEDITNRAFEPQTVELVLDRWPVGQIRLPMSPCQSLTSIIYTDTDGVDSTWDSDKYITDLDDEPARITPAYGESWPDTTLRSIAGIRVRFVAGYPVYKGTVNVAGAAVTWVSGHKFNAAWPAGKVIVVNDVVRTVVSVTSDQVLTVKTGPGDGNGLPYQASDLPEPLRQAMLLLIGHWYANREGVLTGTISKEIEFAVSALCASYRVRGAHT